MAGFKQERMGQVFLFVDVWLWFHVNEYRELRKKEKNKSSLSVTGERWKKYSKPDVQNLKLLLKCACFYSCLLLIHLGLLASL